MAEVVSLGVHTPVALPYLVAEGLLPENPGRDSYQWETHVFHDGNAELDEELFTTKNCVVWSQGKVVRNVYRFDLEGEEVVQAVLTRFPPPLPRADGKDDTIVQSRLRIDRGYGTAARDRAASASSRSFPGLERAVVALLKTKAHVYFLQGSNLVLDLPFGVARAYAAPRGLVLQRNVASPPSLPRTLQVPAPPPNSFFSSQMQASSSYLHSPTLAKSFGGFHPVKPSPLGGETRLDSPFRHVFGTANNDAEADIPTLYSLTTPLSDFGVVTYSIQHHRPRLSSKSSAGLSVEFEALDPAERIVYLSPCDELEGDGQPDRGSLTLLVTVNDDTRTLTVWHTWYIDEQSLSSLLKQRASRKAAKTKRRSSFMSANVATGASTPAVRARDGARESFAAGTTRPHGETGQATRAASTRRQTRQEEQVAMEHQMDPDFQPSTSQQNATRRISSLNTDVRAGQPSNTSFAGAGGRRNTSFGGPGDRRSTGHRKSRGSTPGSVFSRSLGPEDDLMELDSSFDFDNEENVDAILRHIRATHEAASADFLFGGSEENSKRELVVHKIHSLPMPFAASTERDLNSVQVLTLKDPLPSRSIESQCLGVYIRNASSNELTCLLLNVRQRLLWPGAHAAVSVAIPTLANELKLGKCSGILKLTDGRVRALHSAGGLYFSPLVHEPCPVHTAAQTSAKDRMDLPSAGKLRDSEIRRTMQDPDTPVTAHPGSHGRYDETENGLLHRRQLKLRPSDGTVDCLLQVCRLSLPSLQAQMMTGMWMLAHAILLERPELLIATSVDIEMVALTVAIFLMCDHFVDEKARASLQVPTAVSGKPAFSHHTRSQQQSQPGPLQSMTEHESESCLPEDSTADDRDRYLVIAARLADDMLQTTPWLAAAGPPNLSPLEAGKLLLALHVFGQELKLCVVNSTQDGKLAAMTAQLGALLGLKAWSFDEGSYFYNEGAQEARWVFIKSTSRVPLVQLPLMDEPVSHFEWFEHAMKYHATERYPSLSDIVSSSAGITVDHDYVDATARLTPRILSLSDMLTATSTFTVSPAMTVELMAKHSIGPSVLETLPEAVAAPFKEAIARCERAPPSAWPTHLLRLVGRDDIDLDQPRSGTAPFRTTSNGHATSRDAHTICTALEQSAHNAKTKEASRHAVSQLIFSEDRRLVEATSLMHYNSPQVAECPKQPDWTDAFHFEQQRRVLQWVTTRMIALPSGDGMLHFDSQMPLLTEKYYLSGFSNACVMQPMGHTLTADRSGLTEEKVNWAYFHAGVSAGLRISKNAQGIDTSWIAFNKPNDLTNRHAGLLLALGLRGHLRHLAKWLSFKYLTPKHTVTSVGLLLGLSASYRGTMDGLITRMLSVHITRMLPPGAAELNVSPITQTAGLMGIGLLYCNTQHRRMSEIMLSEVEHMELEDPDSGPDPLRDESYRLAAGFGVGLINLGRGDDLRGLSGMYLPERLLAIAVGSRPVSAVHVFDRATAGAIVAITLVYMKSGDHSIARKIDIPDTEAQFDHVRPDMLMLRATAKHIILWDGISTASSANDMTSFTQRNLPPCFRDRFKTMTAARHSLKSFDVPFFNIASGLVLALSLKYAGSGDRVARDEILLVLDHFYKAKGSGDASFYYDAKLTRSTVRRCIDVVALAAATVMAGTGDLKTFRYLRRLHGRTDPETPYGSHLAAHLAIGVLFLGGGTYTFGTSNLAVASLLCAFYPLFPTDVQDNRVHLQAFRHLWVFAAEARCLVVEDIDTQRPMAMTVVVTMRDGSVKNMASPCLLPELDKIAMVHTSDPSYWRVTLDFAANPKHLEHFKETQRIFVRRCPPSEARNTTFTATIAALNDAQISARSTGTAWQGLFDLAGLRDIDKAETELILPPNPQSSASTGEHGTSVDDRLVLSNATGGSHKDALWNLRMLFAWAEKAREEGDGRIKWMGDEVIDTLKARIEERIQSTGRTE